VPRGRSLVQGYEGTKKTGVTSVNAYVRIPEILEMSPLQHGLSFVTGEGVREKKCKEKMSEFKQK